MFRRRRRRLSVTISPERRALTERLVAEATPIRVRAREPKDYLSYGEVEHTPGCKCRPTNVLYWELSEADTSACPIHGACRNALAAEGTCVADPPCQQRCLWPSRPEPTPDRYARMGADGEQEGLFVAFEPGFGLNVVVGFRANVWVDQMHREHRDYKELRMSIECWERLGQFVDEWRRRERGSGYPSYHSDFQ